jgi:hypothetical protein
VDRPSPSSTSTFPKSPGNEPAGEGDRLRAPLDAHDATRRANALREEIETTVRAAADLDDARAAGYPYLIKQPVRFMRELLRLLLQPLLFRLSVTKNVLIGFGHATSSPGRAPLSTQ